MTDLQQETAQQGKHGWPVEAWDAIAALYDKHVAPGEADLATAGLRLAGLQSGDTFLDVAAGPGGLSLPAARLGANVLATDWSPKMIEQFNARVVAEGLDAEGRVMDCHALDLPDDSHDVTGSLFGVMLVPDQAQALHEMVRVTSRADVWSSSAMGTRLSSRPCTSSSVRCRRWSPSSRDRLRTNRCLNSRSPTRTSCGNG
jgi:2-polyprenyl-3-methyl-5-hydroxy-6-metoxy-1,4-benzoquinol methylase